MFRVKSGSHFNEVEKERYLVIGRDYVATEHPDAEYDYRGVFVAAIHPQAKEKRP